MLETRDHGGGLDAAVARYGGAKGDWLDLSTGINPVPYPVGDIPQSAWTALPDRLANERLLTAARNFWGIPDGAEIVLAPGASALIARLPTLFECGEVFINNPTYNEYDAAFRAADDWLLVDGSGEGDTDVFVHPNNPSGRLFEAELIGRKRHTVVDESFCDVAPGMSHVTLADSDGVVILKSFGKFWGLAGLRLGAAICAPRLAARFRDLLGPWPVSGPALEIATRALRDTAWAEQTRDRLTTDAERLDWLMTEHGANVVGGTSLFRLYEVDDAEVWQARLAAQHVWTRIFPYSKTWLRLGLPAPDDWAKLEAAVRHLSSETARAAP